MKMPLFLLGLVLLALLLALAGHGAHHQHHYPASRQLVAPALRVVRPPAVARQHRQVREVREVK